MIKQRFVIPDYDWVVYAYYNVDDVYANEILALLDDIGINEYQYISAVHNLRSKRKNRGLCFSNFDKRISVMVISDTSSPAQFMNSWAHEVRHLERHIDLATGINPYGEEAAYLAGDIAALMFPKAKYFLCHCYGL